MFGDGLGASAVARGNGSGFQLIPSSEHNSGAVLVFVRAARFQSYPLSYIRKSATSSRNSLALQGNEAGRTSNDTLPLRDSCDRLGLRAPGIQQLGFYSYGRYPRSHSEAFHWSVAEWRHPSDNSCRAWKTGNGAGFSGTAQYRRRTRGFLRPSCSKRSHLSLTFMQK